MMSPSLPQFLDLWQDTLAWQPTEEQQQKFQNLYEQILIGNRQLNLTRITEPSEFWEKHLWDSLSGLEWLAPEIKQQGYQVIDIGTGAGFPGLPIALAYPLWQITLLDSTRKKLTFIQQILENLSIENAKILVGRAEAIASERPHREIYDLATIRAVATASVCAEYALPFLKVGGVAILYRGQWSEAENENLKAAIELLGGQITVTKSWRTPLTQSIRHCIYLEKISRTPDEYPREIGIPAQHPL